MSEDKTLDGTVIGTVKGPCFIMPMAEYEAVRAVVNAAWSLYWVTKMHTTTLEGYVDYMRRTLDALGEVTTYGGQNGCSDCETMSRCETHHKGDGLYPRDARCTVSAKAWEETWTMLPPEATRGSRYVHLRQGDEKNPDVWVFRPHDAARAKLAAAAPEMARLLLDIAACAECPSCGQDAQMYTGKLALEEHRALCPLVAVLRKAGCAP